MANTDLRTPLSRVRGLGSAKDGASHFWLQRMTAVANVPLMLFLVFSLVRLNGASHAEAVAYLAAPQVTVMMLLAVLSVVYHMRLGMQIVIEDYVHKESTKWALLMLNTFFAFFVGMACAVSLLRLSFAG